MALEDLTGAKYFNAFVSTNPAEGDDRLEVDDHVRGVKNVWKQQFPNIDGVVNVVQAELNLLVGSPSLDDDLPTGTNMIFYQSAAPVNWTQNTTLSSLTGAGLRITTAAGGGAVAGTHSLESAPDPSHTHTDTFTTQYQAVGVPSHYHNLLYNGNSTDTSPETSSTTQVWEEATNNSAGNLKYLIIGTTGVANVGKMSTVGSGLSHNHTVGGSVTSATLTAFAPKYINCILCEKD